MARTISTRAGGQRNPWLRAPLLVTLGFLAAMLAGSALLTLPACTAAGERPLTYLEALFTSTSAVCVTGLTVVDTAHRLSFHGQLVVLLLVQAGGLGIMTLAFLVFLSLGLRSSTTGGELLSSTLSELVYHKNPRQAFGLVVGGTLLVELLGALILLQSLHPEDRSLWKAVFLSICAFCNAGFDNLESGLAPYSATWGVGLPLLSLWLLGGLGFIVPVAIAAKLRRGSQAALDLSAAMILVASALLVPLGALLFALTEGSGLLAGRPWSEQLLLCLFQGNAPRTAGFSMVDLGQAARLTLLTQVVLMLMGGAPGGTAGGVKTTTAWIFCATLWARLRSEEEVVIGRRTIPIGAIRNAVMICVFMVLCHGIFTCMLSVFEGLDMRLEQLTFEVASALGTVGLSTGITAELSAPSQLTLILAMLVGRLGPLTFVYAFLRVKREPRRVFYPHSEVYVG
ncbi:MAG: hypothetical protein EYC70_06565 [Planctomycetota bacterium]|nr:MAG: hypothetical protein EYC70_06565 [Planctomycetota bacterium]